MSSVISRKASIDGYTLPFTEFMSTVYNVDDRPYPYAGLVFHELPLITQKYLSETTQLLSLSPVDPESCLENLFNVRQARQDRLGRTLEGVHRAIIATMSSPPPQECMEELQKMFIAEWRSHLDAYVEEIDALVWFEYDMRSGTSFPLSEPRSLQERTEDVKSMLEFAVQKLQMTNEKIKREEMGEMLIASLMTSEGYAITNEGHISDPDAEWEGNVSDTDEAKLDSLERSSAVSRN